MAVHRNETVSAHLFVEIVRNSTNVIEEQQQGKERLTTLPYMYLLFTVRMNLRRSTSKNTILMAGKVVFRQLEPECDRYDEDVRGNLCRSSIVSPGLDYRRGSSKG